MPLKLSFEAQFLDDLGTLIDYVTLAADDFTAARLNTRIFDRCGTLLQAPGMGAPYGRKSGIRKINEGPYKIFYRLTETEIIILRLWDGRQGNEPALSP